MAPALRIIKYLLGFLSMIFFLSPVLSADTPTIPLITLMDAPIKTNQTDIHMKGWRMKNSPFCLTELPDYCFVFKQHKTYGYAKQILHLDNIKKTPKPIIIITKRNEQDQQFKPIFILQYRNTYPPTFNQTEYSVHFKESQPVTSELFNIMSYMHDPDYWEENRYKKYNYDFTSENGSDTFSIDHLGIVRLKKPLDYEGIQEYKLNITVVDYGINNPDDRVYTSSIILNVHVEDVDDEDVKFEHLLYQADVKELASKNTLIDISPKPNAYDQDKSFNSPIGYSLCCGTPSGFNKYFGFNNKTRQLILKKNLNWETNKEFTANLEAFQLNQKHSESDRAVLLIKVIRGDKYAPVMNNNLYSVNISELSPSGTIILQVQAYDLDGDVLEYELKGTNKLIKINSTTGLISLKQKIQLGSRGPIKFKVKAIEKNTKEKKSSKYADVNVRIIDENDHNPVFPVGEYIFDVKETAKISTIIDTISVTDMDVGINSDIGFEILDQDVPFSINENGMIRVREALKPIMYSFTVISYDKAKPFPRSAAVMVHVNVTAVNSYPPECSTKMKKHITVPETTPLNTFLTEIFATDKDMDKLYYTLQGKDKAYFRLDTTLDGSGRFLVLIKTLTAKIKHSLAVTIKVFDGAFTTSCDLTVAVKKVNSNAPKFIKMEYHFTVDEQSKAVTSIGSVKASDDDDDPITYGLLNNTNFSINNTSGVITTNRPFNMDTPTFKFIVFAFDKLHTGTVLVTVQVIDINDHPPRFAQKSIEINITEDMMCSDTPLYHTVATDKDSDPRNRDNLYKTNDTKFNFSNGSLSLTKTTCHNMSVLLEQWFHVIITAFDKNNASLSASMEIKIYFKDINNNVPKFVSSQPRIVTIPEKKTIGSSILRVTATDKDVAPINKLIQYSIEGWNSSYPFYIDSNNGNVYLARQLDYDMPVNDRKFTFTVLAENVLNYTDVSSKSKGKKITINIQDVNDNPPVFDKDPYYIEIEESSLPMKSIYQFSAQDIDIPQVAGQIHYKLEEKVLVPFEIQKNGTLILSSKLNYNKNNLYHFRIIAEDKKHTTYATVIIIVGNTNDKPTIIGQLNFKLLEEQPNRTFIGHVGASDPDNDSLSYKIKHQDFYINPITGDLYSNKKLDYENSPSILDFSVTVSDGNLTDTKTIRVELINLNDHAPEFSKVSYQEMIQWDAAPKSEVTTLTATDKDKNDTITYTIFGDDRFTIDNSGRVTINRKNQQRPIKGKFIILMVTASDGQFQNSALLTVEIKKPFEFIIKTFNVTVDRNKPKGTELLKLTPCHMVDNSVDLSKLNVTISQSGDIVKYNQKCNFIVTNNKLDKHEYHITIILDDGTRHASANVTINVRPVNDHRPTIVPPSITKYLKDNIKPETKVIQVNATDKDFNTGFTYFFKETYGKFEINSETGLVRTTDSLNYKVNSFYNLTIFVADHGSPPLQSNMELMIHVTDSNMYAPKFKNFIDSLSIAENKPKTSIIATITAIDRDGDSVTYEITKGDKDFAFLINKSTGKISVNNSRALDFEVIKEFKLTIKATDNAKNPKSISEVMTIYLTDVNDNTPKFTSLNSYSSHLPIMKYQTVFTVQATDKDSNTSGNNVITYTQLNNKAFFVTNSSSGEVKARINLTQPNIYQIGFKACDGGNQCLNNTIHLYTDSQVPIFTTVTENVTDAVVFDINATSGDVGVNYYLKTCSNFFKIDPKTGVIRTKEALKWDPQMKNISMLVVAEFNKNSTEYQVIVMVIDVNDHSPVFEQNIYNFTVKENSREELFTFRATDVDNKDNTNITYDLIMKDDADGKITLGSITGILSVSNLDREKKASYEATVMAHDGDTPDRSSQVDIYIAVEDVNDNDPKCKENVSKHEVNENSGPQNVIQVLATDVDEGQNGYVFYKLSNDSLPFTINPTTGIVRTIRDLDYEEEQLYTLHIVAYDLGVPRHSTTCTLSVTVVDVCDDLPELTTTFQVPRNFPPGTSIISFTSSRNPTTFNITDDQNLFGINNTTGGVFPKSKIPDQANKYNLSVLAWSNCNVSIRKDVIVMVIDVNDHSPVFVQNIYNFTVKENSREELFTFRATDADNKVNTNITYHLMMTDDADGNITLGSITGILSVSNLDREKKASYEATVMARNEDTPDRSSQVDIYIVVEDVNDNDPVCKETVYKHEVNENSGPQKVIQVLATDVDDGRNGYVLYKLSNDRLPFTINPTTGLVRTIRDLDYEEEQLYTLHIVAYDLGDTQRSTTCTLSVTVVDVCDDLPKLTTTFQVPRNFPPGTSIISFTSSRNPTTFNITDDQNLFGIDNTTGGVFPKSTIPDQANKYNLSVLAWSNCDVSIRKDITISLYDTEQITVPLQEESGSNKSILNLMEIHEFQGKHGISFQLKNFKDTFFIEDNQLKSKTSVDREKKASFHLTIEVFFTKHTLSYTVADKTLNVVVNVTDINDNPPKFLKDTLYYGIPITASYFFKIATIQAVDADQGENAISIYSLPNTNKDDWFYIDPSTGNLYALFIAKNAPKKEFSIEVKAVNKIGNSKAATVKIMVTIYNTQFSLKMIVNQTVDYVRKIQDQFIKAFNNILDIEIIVDHIQVHVDGNYKPDIRRTDILFHSVDKQHKVITQEQLDKKRKAKHNEIEALLKKYGMTLSSIESITVKSVKIEKVPTIKYCEIIIIVLASIIFIGTIFTLAMVVMITRRQKRKLKELWENKTDPFTNRVFNNDAYCDAEDTEMKTIIKGGSDTSSGHVTSDSQSDNITVENPLYVNADEVKPSEEHLKIFINDETPGLSSYGNDVQLPSDTGTTEEPHTSNNNNSEIKLYFDIGELQETDTDDIYETIKETAKLQLAKEDVTDAPTFLPDSNSYNKDVICNLLNNDKKVSFGLEMSKPTKTDAEEEDDDDGDGITYL